MAAVNTHPTHHSSKCNTVILNTPAVQCIHNHGPIGQAMLVTHNTFQMDIRSVAPKPQHLQLQLDVQVK